MQKCPTPLFNPLLCLVYPLEECTLRISIGDHYMLPWIVIGVFGLIGLFVWGGYGLFGGLLAGYFAVMGFGLLLKKASGGMLPRNMRIEAAQEFLDKNENFVDKYISSEYRGNEQEYIESLLERIYEKAAVVGHEFASGTSLVEVQSAVENIIQNEEDENVKVIINELLQFIIHKWYTEPRPKYPPPDAQTELRLVAASAIFRAGITDAYALLGAQESSMTQVGLDKESIAGYREKWYSNSGFRREISVQFIFLYLHLFDRQLFDLVGSGKRSTGGPGCLDSLAA